LFFGPDSHALLAACDTCQVFCSELANFWWAGCCPPSVCCTQTISSWWACWSTRSNTLPSSWTVAVYPAASPN
jgi:hypothetical protein